MDLADEIFADEYVYHSPGTPETRGPEGVEHLISGYRTAFPDLHFMSEELIEADKVACRWTAIRTHRGGLMGILPTGKQVSVLGILISRFASGKCVEDNEVFDALGMMQRLGVLPVADAAATA